MSRTTLGLFLAVAASVFGSQLLAQQDAFQLIGEESTAKAQPTRKQAIEVEDHIAKVLGNKLKAPLDVVEEPLTTVADMLQQEYDITIVFDNSALEEIAVSPETEVTLNLRNVTLGSALDLMFRQPGLEDLTHIIDREVLLITTEERANETMVTKVYRVDDFAPFTPSPNRTGEKSKHRSTLEEVITSCVAFDSWQDNGTGEGEILLMQNPGMLVVVQTRRVHAEIEKLLDQLRATKAEIEADNHGRSGGGAF